MFCIKIWSKISKIGLVLNVNKTDSVQFFTRMFNRNGLFIYYYVEPNEHPLIFVWSTFWWEWAFWIPLLSLSHHFNHFTNQKFFIQHWLTYLLLTALCAIILSTNIYLKPLKKPPYTMQKRIPSLDRFVFT